MGRRSWPRTKADPPPAVVDAQPEMWAHCPRCDNWFAVEALGFVTLLLCPADLHRADATEVRLAS
jgi:hypothetical protein